MKTIQIICTVACGFTVAARAQSYSIDWFTIDGGGGTSSGGGYSLSGTIGQPDAGTLTGGPYTLTGGFWGGPSSSPVETRPLLDIVQTDPSYIQISWAPADSSFILQGSVNPGSWEFQDLPSGNQNPVICNIAGTQRFYRLIKR